ncbi:hypothetical protein RvY_15860-2 [Ramazzottius varieornatus]|uniref:Archease domain-containing protein n=1 Tax=Ramazzottius varieornatus TaxID=947166 RepID=A0A1D1W338_RAMVA|nr:hypothetical protein RvY_15860-2 [Ramazzottius varieornatus]
MFGYMTEIESVQILMEETVEAEGDDLIGLLYHFLDEWLFTFCAEPFFIPRVRDIRASSIFLLSNYLVILE